MKQPIKKFIEIAIIAVVCCIIFGLIAACIHQYYCDNPSEDMTRYTIYPAD